MDISNFIPKTDTVDIELKDPDTLKIMTNEDGSPMVITMYLPHSRVYKEVRHEQTNRRIRASQKKGGKTITAEEIESESTELLVKTTASWSVTYKGKHLKKVDADTAKEIYEEVPFIPEQLYEGVAEADLFTKN